MQASFDIIVRNGFSMNFSIRDSSAWWSRMRMVHVTSLDIQVSLCNPTAMLEDSMTSVNTLYRKAKSKQCIMFRLKLIHNAALIVVGYHIFGEINVVHED